MKKRTIALLGIAIICLGVGSVGSIYYFNQSQNLMRKTANESYTIKDPKNQNRLDIKVSSNSHIVLRPSEDEQFHLSQTSYFNDTPVSWAITEENGGTSLAISKKETTSPKNIIFFNFWGYRFDSIIISIPKEYQDLDLNVGNSSIELNDLKLKKLASTVKSGDFTASSLLTDELTLKNKYGNLSLDDIHVTNQIAVDSQYGDTTFSNTKTNNLIIQSDNGSVHLNQVTAQTKISMGNGDLEVQNHQGIFESTNKNGEVYWNSRSLEDNVSIETGSGNIRLNVANIAKNVAINTQTKLGDSEILEDDRSDFQSNAKGPQISLKSNYGDISVNDDYEDFYN